MAQLPQVAAAHTNGATAIANAIGTASSTATSNQKQALNTANNMEANYLLQGQAIENCYEAAANNTLKLLWDDEPTPPPSRSYFYSRKSKPSSK